MQWFTLPQDIAMQPNREMFIFKLLFFTKITAFEEVQEVLLQIFIAQTSKSLQRNASLQPNLKIQRTSHSDLTLAGTVIVQPFIWS